MCDLANVAIWEEATSMPVFDPQVLKDDREALARLDAILGGLKLARANAPLEFLPDDIRQRIATTAKKLS